jgi:hypothetical protein
MITIAVEKGWKHRVVLKQAEYRIPFNDTFSEPHLLLSLRFNIFVRALKQKEQKRSAFLLC